MLPVGTKVTLLFKVVTLNTKKNTRGAGARPRGRGGGTPEGEGKLCGLWGRTVSTRAESPGPGFYTLDGGRRYLSLICLRAAGVNRGWVSLILVTLVSSHTNVRKT